MSFPMLVCEQNEGDEVPKIGSVPGPGLGPGLGPEKNGLITVESVETTA